MTLLINQGRPQGALEAAKRSLELARASGSEAEIISALIAVSFPLTMEAQPHEVAAIAREAVARAAALGDELEIARANAVLASTNELGLEERRKLFAASIATQKRLGRHRHAALTLIRLSMTELRDGDSEAALRAAAQTVELCRQIEPTMLVRSLGLLALALVLTGQKSAALTTAREQLERAVAAHKPFDCRSALTVILAVQEKVKDPVLHAKLLGFARHDWAGIEDTWWQDVNALRDSAVARVEEQLGHAQFEEYALEGAAWTEETAYRESLKL